MPIYHRLRHRVRGKGYHGTADGMDCHHSPFHDLWDGQPVLTFVERCADTDKDRYEVIDGPPDSTGKPTKVRVEKWHSFFLDQIQLEKVPLLNGTILPIENGADWVTFHNWYLWDFARPGTVVPDPRYNAGGFVPGEDYSPIPQLIQLDVGSGHPCAHLDMTSQIPDVPTILARCNPTRAVLDVPAETIETFGDIAGLILFKGRTLIGKAASVNLAFEFGWKPLISDIKTLIAFGKNLDKRIESLTQLKNGNATAKGTIYKASTSATTEWETLVHSSGCGSPVTVRYETESQTKTDIWGCVEYTIPEKVKADLAKLNNRTLKWEAFEELYALHWRNPAGLWELLPWSWLVDWFYPVQDILRRYSNTMELIPKRYCVMQKTTTTFKSKAIEVIGRDTTLVLDDLACEGTRVTKERYWSDEPSLLPKLSGRKPFLTKRQIGILASLAALALKF